MAGGFAADDRVNISSRPIPQEPMVCQEICRILMHILTRDRLQYIIMQFGMSTNFATVDLDNLPFPSTMLVDYVRVYQKKDSKNIGCDPADFPTANYINTYVCYSRFPSHSKADSFWHKLYRGIYESKLNNMGR